MFSTLKVEKVVSDPKNPAIKKLFNSKFNPIFVKYPIKNPPSTFTINVAYGKFKGINLKQKALIKNLKIAPKNPPHPTKSKSLKLIFTSHHKFFA